MHCEYLLPIFDLPFHFLTVLLKEVCNFNGPIYQLFLLWLVFLYLFREIFSYANTLAFLKIQSQSFFFLRGELVVVVVFLTCSLHNLMDLTSSYCDE